MTQTEQEGSDRGQIIIIIFKFCGRTKELQARTMIVCDLFEIPTHTCYIQVRILSYRTSFAPLNLRVCSGVFPSQQIQSERIYGVA